MLYSFVSADRRATARTTTSYINASIDIGEVVDWITDKFVVANKGDLAVLHNRNKMVNAFANTEWVSGGAIISRSVTSCAGMTACLVLLAQTRVGFLSGGRGKSFPPTPTTRTGCPKRRGQCKGHSGPSFQSPKFVRILDTYSAFICILASTVISITSIDTETILEG